LLGDTATGIQLLTAFRNACLAAEIAQDHSQAGGAAIHGAHLQYDVNP
jgi:hypothetical protein